MGITDHTTTSSLPLLNKTSTYLESLKNKFADYDKTSNKSATESATSYFQTAMDRASDLVEQLKNASEDVRTDGNNVSDSAVESAKHTMDQANAALDDLGNRHNRTINGCVTRSIQT
ncbi:unnamed protein product [Peronospora effusa]|nr:unnamed protein product [Peronospora effusa]